MLPSLPDIRVGLGEKSLPNNEEDSLLVLGDVVDIDAVWLRSISVIVMMLISIIP